MAEWLNRRLAHSTRVLVSPAVRCQETAKALGLALALGGELACQVVAGLALDGLGVTPQDQVHDYSLFMMESPSRPA